MTQALAAQNIVVEARTSNGNAIRLVDGVSIDVGRGEVVGIIGETGAGKTLTMRAMLGLCPRGTAARGSVTLGGSSTLDLSQPSAVRRHLGRELGIVLQNPAAMLDPLVRLGDQLIEGVVRTRQMGRKTARDRAITLLERLGFLDPDVVVRLFPHQISGGMKQRIAIAVALMPSPTVLVVDEPTSALDAVLRVEVLRLLCSTASESGTAVFLVSHDLGLVGRFCARTVVIYAGEIVEQGPTDQIVASPGHPYTSALLDCSPSTAAAPLTALPAIRGETPQPGAWASGCRFSPRCDRCSDRCLVDHPDLHQLDDRAAACHFAFAEPQP